MKVYTHITVGAVLFVLIVYRLVSGVNDLPILVPVYLSYALGFAIQDKVDNKKTGLNVNVSIITLIVFLLISLYSYMVK